jgi:hypothetical protein
MNKERFLDASPFIVIIISLSFNLFNKPWVNITEFGLILSVVVGAMWCKTRLDKEEPEEDDEDLDAALDSAYDDGWADCEHHYGIDPVSTEINESLDTIQFERGYEQGQQALLDMLEKNEVGEKDVPKYERDPYIDFAAYVLNKPLKNVTKEERQAYKSIFLSYGYALGPREAEEKDATNA